MTCLPVARGGERNVDGQRGVKVNECLFWNPVFSRADIAGKSFPVRLDPWDVASVYVQIDGEWLHAKCRNLLHLGQLNSVEHRILSAEYLARHRGRKVQDGSPQRLEEFLRNFEPTGVLARDIQQQRENNFLHRHIGLASVPPPDAPLKDRIARAHEVEYRERLLKTSNSRRLPTAPVLDLPCPRHHQNAADDEELLDLSDF